MQAFFTAAGPLFKTGGVKAYDSVSNIHVYSLLAHILGIESSKYNQGNFDAIKNVLA